MKTHSLAHAGGPCRPEYHQQSLYTKAFWALFETEEEQQRALALHKYYVVGACALQALRSISPLDPRLPAALLGVSRGGVRTGMPPMQDGYLRGYMDPQRSVHALCRARTRCS